MSGAPPGVTRHRETFCPYCGARHTAAAGARGRRGPEPGDVTLCIRCAAVLVFDLERLPRKPRPGEIAALIGADPELGREIERFHLAQRAAFGGGTA